MSPHFHGGFHGGFHHHHCPPPHFHRPGCGIIGAIAGAAVADAVIESSIASRQIAAANAATRVAQQQQAAAIATQQAYAAQQQAQAAAIATQQAKQATTQQVWNSLVTAEGFGQRGDAAGAINALSSFKSFYLSVRAQVDPASIPSIDARVAALENWIRSAQPPPPTYGVPPPSYPQAPQPIAGNPYSGLSAPPPNYL